MARTVDPVRIEVANVVVAVGPGWEGYAAESTVSMIKHFEGGAAHESQIEQSTADVYGHGPS